MPANAMYGYQGCPSGSAQVFSGRLASLAICDYVESDFLPGRISIM
jgi:hypothetical protein